MAISLGTLQGKHREMEGKQKRQGETKNDVRGFESKNMCSKFLNPILWIKTLCSKLKKPYAGGFEIHGLPQKKKNENNTPMLMKSNPS